MLELAVDEFDGSHRRVVFAVEIVVDEHLAQGIQEIAIPLRHIAHKRHIDHRRAFHGKIYHQSCRISIHFRFCPVKHELYVVTGHVSRGLGYLDEKHGILHRLTVAAGIGECLYAVVAFRGDFVPLTIYVPYSELPAVGRIADIIARYGHRRTFVEVVASEPALRVIIYGEFGIGFHNPSKQVVGSEHNYLVIYIAKCSIYIKSSKQLILTIRIMPTALNHHHGIGFVKRLPTAVFQICQSHEYGYADDKKIPAFQKTGNPHYHGSLGHSRLFFGESLIVVYVGSIVVHIFTRYSFLSL